MAADEAELSRAVWTRPLWSPWCRRWWGWAGIGAEARVDLLQIDFRQLETRLDVWTLWLTGHVLALRDRSARKPLHVCACVTGMCGSEYEFLVNEHVVNVFIETLALGKQAVRVNQLSVTSHPVSSVRCWILQVSRCRTVTSVLSLSACFCWFLIDRRQTRHTSAARDQTATLIISFSCRSSRKATDERWNLNMWVRCRTAGAAGLPFYNFTTKLATIRCFCLIQSVLKLEDKTKSDHSYIFTACTLVSTVFMGFKLQEVIQNSDVSVLVSIKWSCDKINQSWVHKLKLFKWSIHRF